MFVLLERAKRKVERDKKAFEAYSIKFSIFREMKVMIWRLQGITTKDVLSNNLFVNKELLRDTRKQTVKSFCSWRRQSRMYEEDFSKTQKLACFLDYCFSKLIYPGLTAFDYFAYGFRDFSYHKRKTFITVNNKSFITMFNFNAQKDCELLTDKLNFNFKFKDYILRRFFHSSELNLETLERLNSDGLDRVICKPTREGGGDKVYSFPQFLQMSIVYL